VRLAASLAGALAIAAAIVLFSKDMHYPGFAAIVPTLGTLLILAAGIGDERSPFIRMLAARPAVTIGVLSYSWYLWHWPALAFARSLTDGHTSTTLDVVACAAALALAVPTYVLIELPMRDLRQQGVTRRRGGAIIAMGLGVSAAIALLALGLSRNPALDRGLSAQDLGQPSMPMTACRSASGVPTSAKTQTCMVGTGETPSVVFWGDSHAIMLAPVADWIARETGHPALLLGSMVCPPLLGIEIDYFSKPHCAAMNAAVSRWLAHRQPDPMAGVVLAARWPFYNEQDPPSPSEPQAPRIVRHDVALRGSSFEDMLSAGLGAVLKLLDARTRVLIVGSAPELDQVAPDCVFRARLYGRSRSSCAMTRADVEARLSDSVRALEAVAAKRPNTLFIDPVNVFCDRENCLPFGDDGIFYSDENHLTPLGTEKIYRRFRREFRWVFGDDIRN